MQMYSSEQCNVNPFLLLSIPFAKEIKILLLRKSRFVLCVVFVRSTAIVVFSCCCFCVCLYLFKVAQKGIPLGSSFNLHFSPYQNSGLAHGMQVIVKAKLKCENKRVCMWHKPVSLECNGNTSGKDP